MGKVGSQTIYQSLKSSKLDLPLFHVHVLTAEGIHWEEHSYFGDEPWYQRKSQWPTTQHILNSHYLRRKLGRGKFSQKLKVITLVREPIARNISAFFQTIDQRIPNFYEEFSNKTIGVSDLIEIFYNDFTARFEAFEFPYDWFDKELKTSLGIDIFSVSFPRTDGYQIYHSGLADVLVLKLEMLDMSAEKAMNEFLNLRNFQLHSANAAKNKRYYPIYQEFLNTIKIPARYLEKQYARNRINHFYTSEEISNFISRWQR